VEDDNSNNYSEILTHLLNLPSLKKLKWSSPDASTLLIHNPSIQYLMVYSGFANYSPIFRAFPNIQMLEFSTDQNYSIYVRNNSLIAMNSLKHFKEIKFNGVSDEILNGINCPQLEKLTVTGDFPKYHQIWKKFAMKHPNIECLELLYKKSTKWSGYPDYYKRFIDFKKLRILKVYQEISYYAMEIVEFIEKLLELERLELVLSESCAKTVVQHLRMKHSDVLTCDLRKYDKYRFDQEFNWLITVRKI
jgi:hypothetical protein